MKPSVVIILNTLATYGRSVIALLLGLLSARWLLAALGEINLGLWNLVGSFIAVVTLFNGVLQLAVSRYYAFAIGQSRTMSQHAGEEYVCQWFNSAFSIHLLLPLIITILGLPIGLYAFCHWFVVPPDRLNACLFAFCFSILNAFFSMISVPYMSLFTAYQFIAELSVFQLLQTVLNFIAVFSLLWIKWDGLVTYSVMITSINALILLLVAVRAWKKFPFCRIHLRFLFDKKKIFQMFNFAGWELFSSFGDICMRQGAAFMINRKFGPSANASFNIANQVSSHTSSFANALMGALSPAVSTSEGEGTREKTVRLAYCCSKFMTLLVMFFAIPLILEMDQILKLWLVNPPLYTKELCICILFAFIVHRLGVGQHLAIQAKGKIKLYHSIIGSTSIFSMLLISIFLMNGLGVTYVGIGFIICYSLLSLERAIMGSYLVGISIRKWLIRIVIPILLVMVFSILGGKGITQFLSPSFLRIVITASVTSLIILSGAWFLILDLIEKKSITCFLRESIKKICKRLAK